MSEMYSVWVKYCVDILKVHLMYCIIYSEVSQIFFVQMAYLSWGTMLTYSVNVNVSYFQYCDFYETRYTEFGISMFGILMYA